MWGSGDYGRDMYHLTKRKKINDIIYIMSGVIDFSYNTFYKYYTNTNNSKTETDKRIKEVYFYKNNKNNKKPEQSNTSTNYIIINDVKVYITPYENDKSKRILFTIPTEHNGQLYDYHYHFGIRKLNNPEINAEVDEFYLMNSSRSSSRSKSQSANSKKTKQPIKTRKTIKNNKVKNITTVKNKSPSLEEITDTKLKYVKQQMNPVKNLVFFHKTIQIPDSSSNLLLPEGKHLHIECYFQDNIQIKKIKDIICMNVSGTLMENQFTDEELLFIDEIIRRPFNENKYKHKPRKLKTRNKPKNTRKTYTEKKESAQEKYKILEQYEVTL
jgi:hypothetical protein